MVECVICDKTIDECKCDKWCIVCFEETGNPNYCNNDVDYEEWLADQGNA